MTFTQLELPGVWLIQPRRHGDHRGYFAETYRQDLFEANVGPVDFVQENESASNFGVLRGLHFQRGVHSQAKLVRVSVGTVLDVAVDLRPGSPTYGHHVAVELSADNGLQLFIPRGMAHGFVVLSPTAQFQYKVDNIYCPQSEATLRFDDPALAIDWRLNPAEMKLSAKDLEGATLDHLITDFEPYAIHS